MYENDLNLFLLACIVNAKYTVIIYKKKKGIIWPKTAKGDNLLKDKNSKVLPMILHLELLLVLDGN